jgi:hypothetical protein
MRFLSSLAIAVLVTACSGHNTNLSTLQISGATAPFPENYQEEAARILRDRRADPEFVRVSYPQTTVGAGIGTLKRWYVCLRGIPAPAGPPRRNWTALAEGWVRGQQLTDVFEVVLVFSGERRPAITTGFDSPLCRDATYEPITAEPPVT